MRRLFIFIISAFESFTQYVFAEDSVDLRSIQHKFLELVPKEEHHPISDQAQWQNFWRRFSSEPVPMSVDLEKSDIIIFLMGSQSSGGYSVTIESIERAQKHLTGDIFIHVLLCHPPPDQPQVTEVSSPYAAKVIPKRLGKVIWKTRKQVNGSTSCK